MDKKIIIAVDGYSSCGKSTLAKDLAKELNYIYIDSGAMYRAVTLYLLDENIDIKDQNAVVPALEKIQIRFKQNEILGRVETYLNDRNVEELIRSPKISRVVSEVSTIKGVREFLVKQQKEMGLERGIVMDGRDIGTVVFTDAELKLFITADVEIRAQRRHMEMLEKGISITIDEVKQNLDHRDHIDTHREESPLYKANDAILIDNTILTREQQLRLISNLAKKVIEDANGGPKEANVEPEEVSNGPEEVNSGPEANNEEVISDSEANSQTD